MAQKNQHALVWSAPHLAWPKVFIAPIGKLILILAAILVLLLAAIGLKYSREVKQLTADLPIVGTSESADTATPIQTADASTTSDTPAADTPAASTPATPATTGGSSSGSSSGGGSGSSGGGGGGSTPATCSGSANTPGGSDGVGGCFPGANNTGVPSGVSLTNYSSPCTITTPNTVIDAKNITCSELLIRANNVTISRSRIKDSVHGMESLGYAFTITDSEIDGAMGSYGGVACVNCGVDGYDFTILRSEIVHTNRGAFCEYRCTIKDSWIHAVNLDTSPCPQASSGTCPHASALRVEQYATLTHNTLACDFTGPFNDDLGCSADMSGYPDFAPINHNTMDGNLYVANPIGLGFCAYGGGTNGKPYSNNPANATYIVFKNNVFQRGSNGKCGTWGAVTDFMVGRTGNVWTNNKWSDGATVDPE